MQIAINFNRNNNKLLKFVRIKYIVSKHRIYLTVDLRIEYKFKR